MITKSLGLFYRRTLGMRNKAIGDVSRTSLFVDIGNKGRHIIKAGKLLYGDNHRTHINHTTSLLRSYFSSSPLQTNNQTITTTNQHDISFDIRRILNAQSNKSSTNYTIEQATNAKPQTNQAQKGHNLYKDYISVYKQNKQRLERVALSSSSSSLSSSSGRLQMQVGGQNIEESKVQEEIFDNSYVKKLVDMKYYYADVVNVATWLTEHLIGRINGQKQTISQLKSQLQTTLQQQSTCPPLITATHLHFLLYVYHLYPRQSKNLKDRMTTLLNYYLDSQQLPNIDVSSSMQFLFYLRKFIQNQYYHKFNKHIENINVKYTRKIQLSFIKYKQQRLKQVLVENGEKQIGQESREMIFKGKMLHNYLLIFPNLWNSPKKPKNQQPQSLQRQPQNTNSPICKQSLEVYDFFVGQFSQLLTQSILYWLQQKNPANDSTTSQSLSNLTQKKLLQSRFKQLELNKAFSQLKLSLHRLTVIFDPPKIVHNMTKRNHNRDNEGKQMQEANRRECKQPQQQQQQQQQRLSQQYLQSLVQKYTQGQLNIINYLSADRLATQTELLTLMILFKNLISYHNVRTINSHVITHYLFNLFENNTHLINTNQPELRKQIKITIGQIVSKLASATWTDKDDKLHKFLTPEIPHNINEKVTRKRDTHRGQWFNQTKDY